MSMPSSARISTAEMLTTRNELIDLSSDPIALARWARRSAGWPAGERPAGLARSGRSADGVLPSTVSRVSRLIAPVEQMNRTISAMIRISRMCSAADSTALLLAAMTSMPGVVPDPLAQRAAVRRRTPAR